jgi:hypothetical protein
MGRQGVCKRFDSLGCIIVHSKDALEYLFPPLLPFDNG